MKRLGVLVVSALVLTAISALLPPLFASESPTAPIETRLSGQAAQEYVRKAKFAKKFKAAQVRSQGRLKARGYQPTEIVNVIVRKMGTTQKPKSLLRQLVEMAAPTLSAQTYYTDLGTVVITSWDDQDDDTWEGNFYMYDDEAQAGASLDFQIDVTFPNDVPEDLLDEETVIWAGGDIDEGDEGGGGPIEMVPVRFEAGTSLRMALARVTGQCSCNLFNEAHGALATCMIKGTFSDAFDMIAGAWAGGWAWCRRTGPLFWNCMGGVAGAGTVASVVSSAIGQARDVGRRCNGWR